MSAWCRVRLRQRASVFFHVRCILRGGKSKRNQGAAASGHSRNWRRLDLRCPLRPAAKRHAKVSAWNSRSSNDNLAQFGCMSVPQQEDCTVSPQGHAHISCVPDQGGGPTSNYVHRFWTLRSEDCRNASVRSTIGQGA